MYELLKIMAEQSSGSDAKRHLANHLGVTYQAVCEWYRRGFMPLSRALECEFLFDVPRKDLIDPELYDSVNDVVEFDDV